MGIEGRLNIGLSTESGRVSQVRIDSTRPVHASRVFHGKDVADALRMLPMLFSICGTAQACAGIRACEQARGVSSGPRIENIRDSLVRMETLREHLWRILLDWPLFLDESQEKSGMADMLSLQRDYRQALTAGYDPFQQPGDSYVPDSELPRELPQKISLTLGHLAFGMVPADWLNIDRPATLETWAASGATVAARLIDHVMKAGWSDLGACEIEALPVLETGHLQRVLQDEGFVMRPHWFGDCRESSCLVRADSLLLERLRTQYGNGLLVRLVARLTEIAQLSGNLQPETVSAGEQDPVGVQNPGIGQVAAARGQLVHRVCLEGERVVAYQILAPTEWNFHPRGVVARSLGKLYGNVAQMEQQARLLVNALDPCVGYDLSIG